MYTIKIMNEYLHGPIWVYGPDGVAVWDFPLLQKDPILSALNKQAMERYSAYYEFDSHDQACWVDLERQKADKEIMLDMITRLIDRLNEINDGSYVIEDCETERIKNL